MATVELSRVVFTCLRVYVFTCLRVYVLLVDQNVNNHMNVSCGNVISLPVAWMQRIGYIGTYYSSS